MSDPGFTVVPDDTYKDLLRIKQQHADLIAKLRKQAQEWTDERSFYRVEDPVYATNACGQTLTDICDEAEQDTNA